MTPFLENLFWQLSPVVGGFFLDQLLGDPHWLYHPVRLIGRLVRSTEALLRRCTSKTPRGELLGGVILALAIPAVCWGIPWAILHLTGAIHPLLKWLVELLFCYQILAARCLQVETMKVCNALEAGDLAAARQAVSMVVGRDTTELGNQGVTRAAVETVAENATDGVAAPLFYLVLGGSALGWCYKAVNTLDSMVGYQNERYRYFGKASARLDDLANLLPARLAALCMVLCCFGPAYDRRRAWSIFCRDRYNHPSPNSAQTEAVCAGALGIRLGGAACYGGVEKYKPAIGEERRPLEAEDIRLANRLMLRGAFLVLILLTLGKVWWLLL